MRGEAAALTIAARRRKAAEPGGEGEIAAPAADITTIDEEELPDFEEEDRKERAADFPNGLSQEQEAVQEAEIRAPEAKLRAVLEGEIVCSLF